MLSLVIDIEIYIFFLTRGDSFKCRSIIHLINYCFCCILTDIKVLVKLISC